MADTSDSEDPHSGTLPPDPMPNAIDPCWWKNPWWEAPEYQAEFQVSLAAIRALIDALKRLFNEAWMRRALALQQRNAVVAALCAPGGSWCFRDLLWLGHIASALCRLQTVYRPLKELIGDKSDSTLFEMEVASWFAAASWDTTFLKQQQALPTPDLRIAKDGLECHIECKRAGAEAWKKWADNLSLRVLRVLSRERTEVPYEFAFEPQLSQLRLTEDSLQEGLLDELAERLLVSLRLAVDQSPPVNVAMPGIGELRMRPDWPRGQSGIGGIQVSEHDQMRRMVENLVLRAAHQLCECRIGAVVLRADFVPRPEMIDLILCGINRANPARLHSIAIAVFTAGVAGPLVIWTNPTRASEPAVDHLRQEFGRLLKSGTADWPADRARPSDSEVRPE
jgi:hypothetical protein